MSAISISPVFPTFSDTTGAPLESGYIYIGTAGVSAETNQVSVYWDDALTIPASQPIRTIGGYPVYNGSPAVVYVDGDYSITVKNKQQSLVYSSLNLKERISTAFITGAIAIVNGGTGATTAAGARTNLGAAASGPLASSGITGAAASGANTDITSLGNNTSTIYTTAGTSTAYTITPTPVIAAYAVGQSFVVNFNAASGAAPTLQISGIATPPNLVKENADGTYSNIAANDIPINHRSRVTLISATQALVERMAPFQSMVRVHTAGAGAAGYGSINIAIRRYTTVVVNQGSDITYADSATLGASFTINTSGIYGISTNDNANVAIEMGISLNTTAPSTSIASIPAAERLCDVTTAGTNFTGSTMVTVYLPAGSVIRPHSSPSPTVGTGMTNFTITRVG